MLDGVHLTILIGPLVAVPTPAPITEAVQSVEVRASTTEPSGFDIQFRMEKNSLVETALLLGGRLTGVMSFPPLRVVLVAMINGLPNVLMDGLITQFNHAPSTDGQPPTISVKGEDLSAAMNLINKSGIPYPAMPRELRVAAIIAQYTLYGLIPVVIPSFVPDVPIPVSEIPAHKGTDRQYLRKLAGEVGYEFYVDPGPVPGTSTAYWGPTVRMGVPQPALNVDMDAHTNVERVACSYSPDKPALPVVYVLDKTAHLVVPIPIPNLNPLNPPLGLSSLIPQRIEGLPETVLMSPAGAVMHGLAHASRTSDTATVTGTLDVRRYGRLLKTRSLVGLRGVGMAFDGLYFVQSVTTRLARGEMKQDFTLVRNGLISTLPVVPS